MTGAMLARRFRLASPASAVILGGVVLVLLALTFPLAVLDRAPRRSWLSWW